jgi:cytochrome P450
MPTCALHSAIPPPFGGQRAVAHSAAVGRGSSDLREGYRSVPTLTNTDPSVHTRARRIAKIAFTPRMVAGMESFIRDLAIQLIEERLSTAGEADIVRALSWELPALVIFKVLGVPDEDVPRVKAAAAMRTVRGFSAAAPGRYPARRALTS